jgi:hypothetical protein
MPFAEHFMISGVTSAAQTAVLPSSININCGFVPTKVEIINATQYGQLGTGNLNIQTAFWNSNFPTPTFVQYLNAAGTSVLNSSITANAITPYTGRPSPQLGPAIVGTTITQANPALATAAAHGLQTGDIVLMSNNATMKQLGGLYFSVTVTGANTFTIPINTTNFGAAETGFVIRKVIVGQLFYPQALTISAITQATSMVVSTTIPHNLTVGQKVRILVPAVYGMAQANNIQGVITAIPSQLSFTLGSVNSSAFSAFAYPTAGGAGFAAASPPQVIPFGSGPSQVVVPPFWSEDKLDDAESNVQFQGFTIGTGLLKTSTNAIIGFTASDVLIWTAWRGDV